MSGIVEFLEARIAEDEALARAAIGMAAFSRQTGRWTTADVTDEYGKIPLVFAVAESGARTRVANFSEAWEADERRAHIARHDPARILAECAAKRAIIDSYIAAVSAQHDTWRSRDDVRSNEHYEVALFRALATLATVYSDHSDYQEAWAT